MEVERGARHVLAFFFEERSCQAQELATGTVWVAALAWAFAGTVGWPGACAVVACYVCFVWSPTYVLNAFVV